jgi:hypothetical protein
VISPNWTDPVVQYAFSLLLFSVRQVLPIRLKAWSPLEKLQENVPGLLPRCQSKGIVQLKLLADRISPIVKSGCCDVAHC